MKNAFTGEELQRPEITFEAKRKAGIKLRELETSEIITTGERGIERPKSRGRTYDIPPDNGTYCEDQVDQEGGDYDLNAIMKRLDPTGKKFSRAVASGMVSDAGMAYGDFTDPKSLQEALNITMHAEEQFALLPVDVRNRFDNNAVRFLEYMHDPKMEEEHVKLGFRVKKEVKEPDATNKDVINAIKETAKGSKKAPKGGDSDE